MVVLPHRNLPIQGMKKVLSNKHMVKSKKKTTKLGLIPFDTLVVVKVA